jgi:type II secretion system protein G
MKIRTHRPTHAAAFTLIEIVITLTIIAILASGSIYLLKGQIDSAKDTRVDSDLQAIGLALQSYESRALRKPTTEQGLKALVEKPTTEPIPENYRAFMKDRNTNIASPPRNRRTTMTSGQWALMARTGPMMIWVIGSVELQRSNAHANGE